MSKIKRSLKGLVINIRECLGILIGLVIMCIALSFLTDSFATSANFFNVVRQITINIFLACGMTLVILLGGIDLSVGSVIAVAGCVSAGMGSHGWACPCRLPFSSVFCVVQHLGL